MQRSSGWLMTAASTMTVAAIAACSSAAASKPDTPAVLQESNASTRAAVAAAVSEMLQGAPVALAEDALLHDSWITVERMRPRDAKGQLLNGRVLERPEQFQLVKQQGQCVLVHQSSGKRQGLESVSCRAAVTL